jgi:phytoene synthase
MDTEAMGRDNCFQLDDLPDSVLVGAGDRAACMAAIRNGSRTFHAASLLMPERVRLPALALYAFCRLADDAIDESGDPARALADLQYRLDRAYSGDPAPIAADRAIAATVADFAIPKEIPLALLEGFAWDSARRRYSTLSEVHDYSVRVAGTVGVMMALLMGAREPDALARAADLGVAMQLSNIARDVGEDARAGRLYLPTNWLYEVGIDPEAFVSAPVFSPELASVVTRLLQSAEEFYARAAYGVAALPMGCRPAIHAARLMYAEIGREVARRGGDSVSSRAVVPPGRKAMLVARALSATAWPRLSRPLPVLPEAAFLVEAVVRADAARRQPEPAQSVGLRGPRAQLLGVIALFEKLEERDRAARAARA